MTFLGQRTLTRRRYAAQTVSAAGERVRGATTDTPFLGALQSQGKDRAALREGERVSELWQVICPRGTLRAGDQRSSLEADEVVDGSAIYVVTRVQEDGGILPHQTATLVRRAEPR
jgi:hypothetical protein